MRDADGLLPRVSVVIPVYNVAKYLRQCMESLVGQMLRDIEIICVDDGSTDGSGAILDEYAAKDFRVRVIHQANAGAGSARNAGMVLATGEYLFFCDPDDWCGRSLLKEMWAKAKRDDLDVLVASNYCCNGDDRRIVARYGVARMVPAMKGVFSADAIAPSLYQHFAHVPWNRLFKAAFVRKLGLVFQDLPRYNDAFFVKCTMALAARMAFLDRARYYHRVRRPGSIQAGLNANPLAGFSAQDAVRAFLKERGLFERFKRSWIEDVRSMTAGDLRAMTDGRAIRSVREEVVRRAAADEDCAGLERILSAEGACGHSLNRRVRRLRWRIMRLLPEGVIAALQRRLNA